MNDIEKMMQNANIEKEVIKGCYDYYSKLGIDIWKENDCRGKNCDTCKKDKSIKRYPPFTAEKLINLVIFLINKGDFDIKKGSVDITFESFTSCIAGLINNLWQDLTEEERKQIKIILQEDNQ